MNGVTVPTAIGLGIALLGPAVLFTPARRLLGDPERTVTRVFELLFLWAVAGITLSIVVWWEEFPLESIGLGLRWQSVVLGLSLAFLFVRVISPFLYWMIRKTGTAGFEAGLARMKKMPIWFLVFAAVTAGVVEEILYRGYAIEGLAGMTGSYWLAGLVATAVFALVHRPMWGWGPVATFFVSGGVLALFYIWSRDLVACMIAHAATDAVGFITARRELRSHHSSSGMTGVGQGRD